MSMRSLSELEPAAFERWIEWAIRITVAAYAIFLAVGLALHPERIGSRVGEVVILGITVAAWILRHRGRSRDAGVLLLFAIFAELHFSLFWDGIAGAPGLVGEPVLILAAGFFLGVHWAWRTAALATAGIWLVVLLVHALPPIPGASWAVDGARPPLSEDVYAAVMVTVAAGAAAILTSLSLETLGRLVQRREAARRRFSALVERMPDALLGLDHEHRIETINRAAADLLGIQPVQVVGESVRSVRLPGGLNLGEQLRLDALLAVERGEALVRLPLPGGMRQVEARARVLPREDGAAGHILLLRDVTEVSEARARLSQLGQIVDDALHEIHVFSSRDLSLFFLNRGARKNLGYLDRELPRNVRALNPTLTPDSVRRILSGSGGEGGSVRTVQRRADGSFYPVEAVFHEGVFQGEKAVIAFVVDVTDRIHAEEEQERLHRQLEHSQRMEAVGHLAGGVAHDFNNLLTVMGACAESLRDEVTPEALELVDELLGAQQRGAVLTRQLLAFARKEVVQPETLPVRQLLADMEVLARRVLSERIHLSISVHDDPWIRADRGQFEQVLVNLLANARDAMPDGGTVRLSVQAVRDELGPPRRAVPGLEAPTRICISVADEGTGMDQATRDRIFEPFFTTKERGRGTGLGLATVLGIVAESGGEIDVRTEPGGGTEMRVYWPAAAPGDRRESPRGDPEIGRRRGDRRGRILFAEDNEAARSLLARLLRRSGYQVEVAADGEEAFRRFEERPDPVDLLITDVVMPRCSGIELADRLQERGYAGPVLFISGYLDGHLPRDGGVGEGRELLLKPFRHDELLDRVDQLLAEAGTTD